MATFADVLADKVERLRQRLDKSMGTYEVATTSPFTVYLNGSTTAVPGKPVGGLSYSVGDRGDYFRREGQLPKCIPD